MLTLARDLTRRKARERHELFVVEGVRAAEELLASSLKIRGALRTAELTKTARGASLAAKLDGSKVESATVTDAELTSAADTDAPAGVLVIAEVPKISLGELNLGPRALVLDAIQDPGNVGTLIRTAAALGVGAVIALPGTADVWSAKVVRGGAGGHFHTTVIHAELPDVLAALRAASMPLWGADASGEAVGRVSAPASLAVAVGNEGAGLTAEVRGACEAFVSIQMARGVESLNVGVAAGILLHALRP